MGNHEINRPIGRPRSRRIILKLIEKKKGWRLCVD
jgi:hypothetical protein